MTGWISFSAMETTTTAPAIESVAGYILALEMVEPASSQGDELSALAEDLYRGRLNE